MTHVAILLAIIGLLLAGLLLRARRDLRLVTTLMAELLDEAMEDDPFDGYRVTQGLNQFHRHLSYGKDSAVEYAYGYYECKERNEAWLANDAELAPF
jgi:hypothetical protein